MRIEYYHASKYGNGATVAEEFRKQMADKGVTVNINHVTKANPKDIPSADMYIFSSPGRFGKPIGDMQHFLKKAQLTPGIKYAVLATEFAPEPDNNKRIPSTEEIGKCQRVIPIMNEMLQKKGLVKIAETKIFVTGLKGPLEYDWEKVVGEFIAQISIPNRSPLDENPTVLQAVSVG